MPEHDDAPPIDMMPVIAEREDFIEQMCKVNNNWKSTKKRAVRMKKINEGTYLGEQDKQVLKEIKKKAAPERKTSVSWKQYDYLWNGLSDRQVDNNIIDDMRTSVETIMRGQKMEGKGYIYPLIMSTVVRAYGFGAATDTAAAVVKAQETVMLWLGVDKGQKITGEEGKETTSEQSERILSEGIAALLAGQRKGTEGG